MLIIESTPSQMSEQTIQCPESNNLCGYEGLHMSIALFCHLNGRSWVFYLYIASVCQRFSHDGLRPCY